MKKFMIATSAMLFCVASSIGLAGEACLLETNSTFMGVTLDIKDCVQNAGMPSDEFKAQCEGMSQAVVDMGGPAAKISYLSSCPEPFQAKCDNTNTAKNMFFYYKRAADEAASLQSGCEMMQGKFTKGTLPY